MAQLNTPNCSAIKESPSTSSVCQSQHGSPALSRLCDATAGRVYGEQFGVFKAWDWVSHRYCFIFYSDAIVILLIFYKNNSLHTVSLKME